MCLSPWSSWFDPKAHLHINKNMTFISTEKLCCKLDLIKWEGSMYLFQAIILVKIYLISYSKKNWVNKYIFFKLPWWWQFFFWVLPKYFQKTEIGFCGCCGFWAKMRRWKNYTLIDNLFFQECVNQYDLVITYES